MSEELKMEACPFCGEHFLGYTTAHGPHDGQFQMVCGCGARGPATPEKSVVAMGAAWNLRTPDWRELALEAGKALEPVVALLQRHNDSQRDTSPVFAVNDAELTFGDLRRATHALAAIKATGLEV